jgi:hypothetical protein
MVENDREQLTPAGELCATTGMGRERPRTAHPAAELPATAGSVENDRRISHRAGEVRATAGLVENDRRTAHPGKGAGPRQSVANATDFPQ